MNYNNNPYSVYKNQELNTNSKTEIVGRLFGAAAISLKMAVLNIGEMKFDKAAAISFKRKILFFALKTHLI